MNQCQAALFRTVQEAKLVLLDFDGTFYPFTQEIDEHCNHEGAKAALELISKVASKVPLSYEEALEIRINSYRRHGTGVEEFCCLYGIDPKEWHHNYHDRLKPDYIQSLQVSAEHFRLGSVPLAILSHSNRGWIENVLCKFDLRDFFPDNTIFAFEDVGYHLKSNGGEAYRRTLASFGVEASNAVMVEDSLANLKSAKASGLKTVLITQGDKPDLARHPYVDHAFETLPEFLETISAMKLPERTPRIVAGRAALTL